MFGFAGSKAKCSIHVRWRGCEGSVVSMEELPVTVMLVAVPRCIVGR